MHSTAHSKPMVKRLKNCAFALSFGLWWLEGGQDGLVEDILQATLLGKQTRN